MARIRNIKPETCDDPDLNALSPLARWVFVGLWTEADRDGRMEGDTRRLKVRLVPYDAVDIDALLAELAPRFITRYEVDGKNYIQVNNFPKHQRFHKDEKSYGFPAPPEKSSVKPVNFPAKSPISGSLDLLKSEAGGAAAPAATPPHASASTLVVPLAKPLGFRSRIDVAWPGRPPVPGALHAELRERMAGDETANDAALRAWYPTVAGAYAQQDIGDDPWKFWNARFREWRGTTVKPVKAAEPALDTEQMLANIRQKEARLGRR